MIGGAFPFQEKCVYTVRAALIMSVSLKAGDLI